MIKSFRDRNTEAIFEGKLARRLPTAMQQRARRKLRMLDAALTLKDLRVPPSNHLEQLLGNRKGQHSIRINRQWRLCFIWNNGNAYDVEITENH